MSALVLLVVAIAQSAVLTEPEVAQLLAAARGAVAERTFTLSYQPGGPGPEVLMAGDGRPRFVRTVSGYTSWSAATSSGAPTTTTREYHTNVQEVIEYTRQSARRCDGSPMTGELVIEYRNEDDQRWTAKARARTAMEFAAPIFDMLTGTTPAKDDGIKKVGDRSARALVAPWAPPPGVQPGGPLPPNLRQTLWIDIETLLPLRWEVGAPTTPGYGMSFTFETLDIRAPDGIAAPQCIS